MTVMLRTNSSNTSTSATSLSTSITCNIGDTLILLTWGRATAIAPSTGTWELISSLDTFSYDSTVQVMKIYKGVAAATSVSVTVAGNASSRIFVGLSAYYSDKAGVTTLNVLDAPTMAWKAKDATPSVTLSRPYSVALVHFLSSVSWTDGKEWLASPADATALTTTLSNRTGAYFIPKSSADTHTFTGNTPNGSGHIAVIVEEPVILRHLIRSGNTLYKEVAGVLTPLTETEITGALFLTHGSFTLPTSAILKTLNNPEIFVWTDETAKPLPRYVAAMTAIPPVQEIHKDIDMSDATIKSIKEFTATYTGSPQAALSKDDGATWVSYNGTEWVSGDMFVYNMPTLLTTAVMSSWLGGLKQFKIRVKLSELDTLTELKVHFNN